MLRVHQIKLRPDHTSADLELAVRRSLRLGKKEKIDFRIFKKSIDARHKPDIRFIYSVDIHQILQDGKEVPLKQVLAKSLNHNATVVFEEPYCFPSAVRNLKEEERPVIVGFGPAGIFAALKLAEAGLNPVIYERGEPVEKRVRTVQQFWTDGILNSESNVQFGEGGAGTFSDGKLNTMIKDPSGRIRETLNTFVRFGADASILYVNKPHIGTDVLAQVVKNIRTHICGLGGEIHFNTRLEKIETLNGAVAGLHLTNTETGETLERDCKNVCLAVGHSARDTFEMLTQMNFRMEPKSFAVGLRLEHPQSFIDQNAYGNTAYHLPAADYKVTYQTADGRGVYSFCMCPGGYVVNASSEPGHIAVNGMSYSGRDGRNANSAVIVTVTPEDFGQGVLDGVQFQRKLERLAFEEGQGKIPIQLLGDFKRKIRSTGLGQVKPCIKGSYAFADLNGVLPESLSAAICEGVSGFARTIHGFDMEEAVFSGVESRTSSPVRLLRGERLESSCAGLYPCGEGAGYAGGITSAAVDGLKVAERIAVKIGDNL